MSQAGAGLADRAQPGELMRLVADGLMVNGFNVRLPDREGRCSVTISSLGARCKLSVSDFGYVEWGCSPWASDEADPKRIADLATTLLTGQGGDYPRQGSGYERPGITLKGIVGLEVRARGLKVDLEVYEYADFYDAVAEIVVTNSGAEELAWVRVTDDGAVTWQRDYWPEAAAITWEPEYSGEITDPGKVADSIVDTITRAISLSLAAAAGSCGR